MRELWKDESCVTTVEYALLLAVVALAALVAYQQLGTGVADTAAEAAGVIETQGVITDGQTTGG